MIGGASQTYTLRNILSVHFYQAALDIHLEIPSQVAEGQFDIPHA